jgi:Cu/Ag efflux pump CusA
MIRAVVVRSVRLRLLVLVAAAGLMVLGVSQLRGMPSDTLPEFGQPTVDVQTESLGLSAAEVEQLITVPMEQQMLNGVRGIKTIHSDSIPGLSSIELVFDPGTDVLHARQLVQERLSASTLPNVAQAPQMIQPVSSTARTMVVGLSSTVQSPIDLSVLARWVVWPRLSGLPGVANVAIFGLRDRQLQVLVDPRRLRAHHVTLSQVVSTTGNAQLVSPLTFLDASTPGTGGFIDGPNQRLSIMHVLPFGAPSNLAQVPIEETTGLRLGDVATVTDGHQPLIGDGVVGGGRGLLFAIDKRPGASTTAVTHEVDQALAELQPGLTGVHIDSSIFRPAMYVQSARHDLAVAAIVAAALLAAALAAFLLAWRPVAIALVATAASFVSAAFVLDLLGYSFNALVVAGLLMAITVVVGDAVDDSLAFVRRSGRDAWAATLALRSSLAYATATVLLITVPVLVASGVTASFVRPLAVAFALAVAASMLVALTVTPALAALLRPRSVPEPAFAARIATACTRYATRLARAPRPMLLCIGAVGLAALAVLPFLGAPSRPAFKDRDLVVRWQAAPGTSLAEMDRITTRTAAELRALPGVRDVGADVGRAVQSDRIVGSSSAEIWVRMANGAPYDQTLTSVRRLVGGTPGLRADVSTYESDSAAPALGTPSKQLDVRVYGQDYGRLAATANDLRRRLARISGVRAPRVEGLPVEQPTLHVEVNLPAALRRGLKPGDVRRSVATLVSGLTVGNFFQQQKVFDVVVRGTPATQASVASVQNLLIDAPGGGSVRLRDVARVGIVPAPVDIPHDSVSRYVDVRADVRGRALDSAEAAARSVLRGVALPLEYHAEVVSSQPSGQTSRTAFTTFVIAAELGILILLQAAFGSWRRAAALMLALPFAVSGGLLVALAAGAASSIGTLAGLIAIAAFAVRAGTVLIRRAGAIGPDAALAERVAPTIVSVIAIAAAALPFAAMGNAAGGEIAHQLADVVLGSLVTSTLVILLVVPAICRRLSPPVELPEPAQLTLEELVDATV